METAEPPPPQDSKLQPEQLAQVQEARARLYPDLIKRIDGLRDEIKIGNPQQVEAVRQTLLDLKVQLMKEDIWRTLWSLDEQQQADLIVRVNQAIWEVIAHKQSSEPNEEV